MMAFIQRLPASGFSPRHGSTMWFGVGKFFLRDLRKNGLEQVGAEFITQVALNEHFF
jgi:hypothetical protein